VQLERATPDASHAGEIELANLMWHGAASD